MDDKTTEQAILEAAERQFLEKGLALTSTTEIAREAGCNQALVHYYFRTKEKLFASIFEKKFMLFFSSIDDSLKQDLPFRDKIRTVVERHFAMLAKNPKIPFLVINELSLNPKRIAALRESLIRYPRSVLPQLEAELRSEIEAGRIRETTIPDIMITMISLNASIFIARPILGEVLEMDDAELDALVERRGRENARILLASLMPGGEA